MVAGAWHKIAGLNGMRYCVDLHNGPSAVSGHNTAVGNSLAGRLLTADCGIIREDAVAIVLRVINRRVEFAAKACGRRSPEGDLLPLAQSVRAPPRDDDQLATGGHQVHLTGEGED